MALQRSALLGRVRCTYGAGGEESDRGSSQGLAGALKGGSLESWGLALLSWEARGS